MKKLLKTIAQRFGYDLLHLPTDPTARQWLHIMQANGIDLVFDVGANIGQYAQRIRALGYHGDIVSFDPMTDAYQHYPAFMPVQSGDGALAPERIVERRMLCQIASKRAQRREGGNGMAAPCRAGRPPDGL